MIYAIILPSAIRGIKPKIVVNDSWAKSSGAGSNCKTTCMIIVIIIKDENPNHTAFFASFLPYFSFNISVTKKILPYTSFPSVAVNPKISMSFTT